MSHPGPPASLVPALSHHGGDLGLDPEVHQDPLVLPALLGTPGLGAGSEQSGVLHGAVRVPGAGDDAAGRQLPVPDGVVHEAQGLGPALLLPHHLAHHHHQAHHGQHHQHLIEREGSVR